MFLPNIYPYTCKGLRVQKSCGSTSLWLVFPQHFLFTQTSTYIPDGKCFIFVLNIFSLLRKVQIVKTESTRCWSNKWTKTLYQDYLHCIANFCKALLIIFSKQFISSNTKHRKRILNFV